MRVRFLHNLLDTIGLKGEWGIHAPIRAWKEHYLEHMKQKMPEDDLFFHIAEFEMSNSHEWNDLTSKEVKAKLDEIYVFTQGLASKKSLFKMYDTTERLRFMAIILRVLLFDGTNNKSIFYKDDSIDHFYEITELIRNYYLSDDAYVAAFNDVEESDYFNMMIGLALSSSQITYFDSGKCNNFSGRKFLQTSEKIIARYNKITTLNLEHPKGFKGYISNASNTKKIYKENADYISKICKERQR